MSLGLLEHLGSDLRIVNCILGFIRVAHEKGLIDSHSTDLHNSHEVRDGHIARLLLVDDLAQLDDLLDLFVFV